MEYTDSENYFSIYMRKKANTSQKKKKYGQANNIKNSITTKNHFNQNKTLQSIIFESSGQKEKNSLSFFKKCNIVKYNKILI